MVAFETTTKCFDADGAFLGEISHRDYDRANGLPVDFYFEAQDEAAFAADELRAIADKLDSLNGVKG